MGLTPITVDFRLGDARVCSCVLFKGRMSFNNLGFCSVLLASSGVPLQFQRLTSPSSLWSKQRGKKMYKQQRWNGHGTANTASNFCNFPKPTIRQAQLTSCSDEPCVQWWESIQDLNFSLKLYFVILHTTTLCVQPSEVPLRGDGLKVYAVFSIWFITPRPSLQLQAFHLAFKCGRSEQVQTLLPRKHCGDMTSSSNQHSTEQQSVISEGQ